VAKRTGRKRRDRPDRQVPDGPQAPPETADGPEELADLEKPDEPDKPEEPSTTMKRRSLAGIRCPVCGQSGEPDDDAGRARCGTCGAVFLMERPALGEVAKARDGRFSRAFALPNSEERLQARGLAGEVMRGFFLIRKGMPAALNAFGKNVLEVDCGLGFRLRAFQSYGWTVAGTETSVTAYEYARRQSLDVTHGWLAEGRFGRTRFDLVLFCASFGEMDDPHRTVRQLREIVVEHGLVCVLGEPLADEEAPPDDGSRLFLHTADSIMRSFTGNKFSLVSEDVGNGVGSFWFRAKTGRGK
jgi:SAM-dependent methyltransferase